ncbi:conserved oligomeric Golgi complex subunit 1 isoform X1 [Onthophagus taurus]|uniref:conserved oligomeric Golgi complex subunit 1 isoform X1 n=1 Tax=Onthophagus taurus TaxID=166361 RepID=UPI0039BE5A1D
MFTPLFTRSPGYTQLSGKKSDVALMMEKYNNNLLQIDVDKLFEEHHVKDIIVIKKMFDAEIERKRIELRTMVSDKYKDILTASDAIASMKDMSQKILEGINNIQDMCEKFSDCNQKQLDSETKDVEFDKTEERTIVMQIRLTLALNEHIWLGLDENNFSKAAQYYLLAQHVHTGLRLLKKDILEKVPLLNRIKSNLESLRTRILENVRENLQMPELDAEQTSRDLNTLMLLENQSSSELVNTFIEIRKAALKKVTMQNHGSVRQKLSAMVKCLTSTVLLIHDCFVSYKDSKIGLIWTQLEEIVNEDSPPTLSKIVLPHSPLIIYIPDIIKEFRPKCSYTISDQWQNDLEKSIKDWIKSTGETINAGLKDALELVTTIKGLHIIREEALKISIRDDWESICSEINLPTNFNVWYYFFQDLITKRGLNLIGLKVSENLDFLQKEIVNVLDDVNLTEKNEDDLTWYTWNEDADDISKIENVHTGLSMKTSGYSPNIIKLCEKADLKYLDILKDLSLYLFGKEYNNSLFTLNFSLKSSKADRKFADKSKLEIHLTQECLNNTKKLTEFLINHINKSKNSNFVLKSLVCARFIEALIVLCPNFKRCICYNPAEEWEKITEYLTNTNVTFWTNWVDDITINVEKYSHKLYENLDVIQTLNIFQKWDTIEIQEETEEKTFKSHIKVPYQLSLALQESLNYLCDCLSRILPHTLPKQVHLNFLERNVQVLLGQYEKIVAGDLTQKQALQFLFDVKFLTVFCVPRENMKLVQKSQEVCDKLRENVDPFDLDVFYGYLQNNVKRCTLQSQVILGCLLPNNNQLSNLGMMEKNKEHEKDPSILPISIPSSNSWFPLLPVTAPIQKTATAVSLQSKDQKISPKVKSTKKSLDTANTMRSAAALFGAMTTDWFSNK